MFSLVVVEYWENLLYALADQNFPLDALFKLSFLLGGRDTLFWDTPKHLLLILLVWSHYILIVIPLHPYNGCYFNALKCHENKLRLKKHIPLNSTKYSVKIPYPMRIPYISHLISHHDPIIIPIRSY